MPRLIPGLEFNLGHSTYIVPPLSFRSLKLLRTVLQRLEATPVDGLPTDEQFEDICTVVCEALKRNYPDMNVDTVLDLLDLGNAFNVMRVCVLGARAAEEGQTLAAMGKIESP